MLDRGGRVDVVGEGYREEAIAALVGPRTGGYVEQSVVAFLVLEPDNPVDPEAIAVKIEGCLVGYIKRADQGFIRPLVDAAASRGRVAACRATIVGGRDRADGPPIYGVRLDIRNEAAERLRSLVLPPSELAGKSVCFTGASVCRIGGREMDRAMQERFGAQAGLTVLPRVTRSLDLLVLADVRSTSGKARRAHELGTRCIAEREFWVAVGLPIDE
jgi:NAD-dependent DNA ligase